MNLSQSATSWAILTPRSSSHNPKVAGSNPAPATPRGPASRGLSGVWGRSARRRGSNVVPISAGAKGGCSRHSPVVGRRSYGTGRLYPHRWQRSRDLVRVLARRRDEGQAAHRPQAPARHVGWTDAHTGRGRAAPAHRDETSSSAGAQRRTVAEAGERYVEHLEHVMERKRTTIAGLPRLPAPAPGAVLRRPAAGQDRPRPRRGLPEGQEQDGLSSKTVQNHLNFLHGIFAFAMKRGWATANPVALVDRPRASRYAHRRIRFLQPEELEAVLRAVPDDHLGVDRASALPRAAMTGLRQGELLGLRWLDVDWTASRVRVADSYTRGRVRLAEVPPRPLRPDGRPPGRRARAPLPALALSRRRRPRLLPPATGNVLDPSKLRKRFGRALARAGVRRITFHELRHTFGTQMAAAGAPLRAIQEWMGHADAKTTEIYAHYAPDPSGGARLRRAGVRHGAAGVVSRGGGVGPAATPRRRCGRTAGACRC